VCRLFCGVGQSPAKELMSWVSQKLRSHEQEGHIDSTCYNWLIQQLYDVSNPEQTAESEEPCQHQSMGAGCTNGQVN
jgi:hypothetical protein